MALFGSKKEVRVIVSGETSKYERSMRNVKRANKKMAADFQRVWKTTAKRVAVLLAGAFLGLKEMVGSFLDAAKVTESYQIRLQALLGSVEEGKRLFKEMSEFASRVPFEFEEIMAGATQLAGVMRGGVDEIKKWMPLIGDLAAVSGLTIQKTIEQVVRMYSAGAAAADLFRERGITAMLGFQAKTQYSAEQTRDMMMAAWTKVDSKFRGVTADLAKSWTGMISMLRDKWFQFRNLVMEAGVFDELKKHLSDINDRFGVWIKQNAELIKSKVPEYIDKIVWSLQKLVAIYNALPDGVIGAAGTGIVARILTGSVPIAKAAAMFFYLNTQLEKINMSLGQTHDKAKSAIENLKNVYEGLVGIRDFGTGKLAVGAGEVITPYRKPRLAGEVGAPGDFADKAFAPEGPTKEQIEFIKKAREEMIKEDAAMLEKTMKQFDDALIWQEEREQESQQLRKEIRDTAREEELAALDAAMSESDRIIKESEERRKEMGEQGTRDFKNNLLNGLRFFAGQSKAMMVAYKAVAIGIAIAEGVISAVAAFKNGMIAGGPYAGPALAAAYMAASILATGAQIAAIGGTQPGATPGGATGTFPVSPTTGLPTNEPTGRSLTINIQGDMIGDESYLEMLARKISEAVEDRDIRLVASEAQTARALA